MSTTVGDIDLGEEMVLRGLDSDTVSVEQQRTDDGVSLLLVAPLEGGRVLELDGEITLGIEEQLLALSAAGAAVSLIHPRWSGQVIITGVDMDFVIDEFVNPTSDSLREGSIFFIEV